METVVLVLMILVCFNFLLKQTLCNPRCVAVVAAVCALFTALMWPYAIEQSKDQIREWLSNPALMLDTSVVLTVEVVMQMAFCLLVARMNDSERMKRRTVVLFRILLLFPGVLIFAVLFSLLVTAIFALPGVSFRLVAAVAGGVVMLAVPSGTLLIKKLLPERDIRLELLFLGNALTAVLGVIATVNGQVRVAGTDSVDGAAFAFAAAAIAVGAGVGFMLYRLKINKITKRL